MAYIALDMAIQAAAAGASPTFTQIGRRQSGTLGYEQSVAHRTGGRGDDSMAFGLLYATGSVNWLVQDKTFLTTIANGNRLATGYPGSLPTAFQVQGGTDDAACVRHQTGCLINRLAFEGAVGEALSATAEWYATGESDLASWTVASPPTGAPMEWYKADCKIGGSAYVMESFSAEITHNLRGYGSLDAGVTGTLRWVEGFLPGPEAVTASAQLRTPLGVDLIADDPQSSSYTLACTWTNGTTSLTLTLTGMVVTGMPLELGGADDEIFWAVDFEAPLNSNAWVIT